MTLTFWPWIKLLVIVITVTLSRIWKQCMILVVGQSACMLRNWCLGLNLGVVIWCSTLRRWLQWQWWAGSLIPVSRQHNSHCYSKISGVCGRRHRVIKCLCDNQSLSKTLITPVAVKIRTTADDMCKCTTPANSSSPDTSTHRKSVRTSGPIVLLLISLIAMIDVCWVCIQEGV